MKILGGQCFVRHWKELSWHSEWVPYHEANCEAWVIFKSGFVSASYARS